jgi:2-dehydro-3-deoxygluconokinase
VNTRAGVIERPDALAIGEPLVALIGHQTEVPLVEVSGYSVHVTGAELNTAVGLARLGHRVAFAGRVGDDPFGQIVRRRLAMEGVDTRWLADDEHPTGMLFRNLRRTAPAEVVYRRAQSAGTHLSREQVERAIDDTVEGGVVVTTGVTAAVCPDLGERMPQLVRDAGRRLCVDLNFRSRLWSRTEGSSALRKLADGAYLVAGSRGEAELATGLRDADEAARALLEAGAQIVVLRHDTVAASWFSPDTSDAVTVAANPLPAVDPVGAGDAFMAGLISGILEFGASEPTACLRRAHHCGAGVIATVGDLEGGLYRSELRAVESGAIGDDPLR